MLTITHFCRTPCIFSARTMRAKVRRDVIRSEGMSKNIMILNSRGLSTGWCSENDVMWLLNLPVWGIFIKTLDAYQTAATYLWTRNLEGEIMKTKLCLIPVKCSSDGALTELVITFLQTEKLWKVMLYQRFKRHLHCLAGYQVGYWQDYWGILWKMQHIVTPDLSKCGSLASCVKLHTVTTELLRKNEGSVVNVAMIP